MSYEDFDDYDEFGLGISPLGMILVVMVAFIGVAIFLNPGSELYDVQIGGVIALSIALSFGTGLQRWENEGDLKRTLIYALVGASTISIAGYVLYTARAQSTVSSSLVLALAIPAVFEELLFRDAIYRNVARKTGSFVAMIIATIFFATYHFARNPDQTYLAFLFVAGIILQVVYILSKNLLSSMLAHAISNLRPVLWSLLFTPQMLMIIFVAVLILLWRLRSNG